MNAFLRNRLPLMLLGTTVVLVWVLNTHIANKNRTDRTETGVWSFKDMGHDLVLVVSWTAWFCLVGALIIWFGRVGLPGIAATAFLYLGIVLTWGKKLPEPWGNVVLALVFIGGALAMLISLVLQHQEVRDRLGQVFAGHTP